MRSSPGFSAVEDVLAVGSDSADFKLPLSPSISEEESDTDSCGKRRAMGMCVGSAALPWEGSRLDAISFGRWDWMLR